MFVGGSDMAVANSDVIIWWFTMEIVIIVMVVLLGENS